MINRLNKIISYQDRIELWDADIRQAIIYADASDTTLHTTIEEWLR